MIKRFIKSLIIKRVFKSRYKFYRKRLPAIHQQFIEAMNKRDITKGSKSLHIIKDGALVFNTEEEGNVLADYCIHNTPSINKNYVDLFLEKNPSPEEIPILNSLKNSRFSIYRIENHKRGFGILAEDILYDEKVIILDKSLSYSELTGFHLAGRLLPFLLETDYKPFFGVLSGACLPIDDMLYPSIKTSLDLFKKRNRIVSFESTTPQQKSDLEALVLRKCLKSGASEKVRYL